MLKITKAEINKKNFNDLYKITIFTRYIYSNILYLLKTLLRNDKSVLVAILFVFFFINNNKYYELNFNLI